MAGSGSKGGIAKVTEAVKGAATAVADAATKLVGAEDSDAARERAEAFADRAERQRRRTAEADAAADYDAAIERRVASFAEMPENAELTLRFADGRTFIEGAIALGTDSLKKDSTGSGRVLYRDPVNFEPEGEPAVVTEAWLIAASGETVMCEVTPGLPVGGGRVARIPGENLIF